MINILGKKNTKAILYKEKKLIKLKPTNTLLESIEILSDFVGESVPVVDEKNFILGTISENDVLKSYDMQIHDRDMPILCFYKRFDP